MWAIPHATRPPGSRLATSAMNIRAVLGAVLVGGESKRFGYDKAAALFRGQTLLDHQLATLHDATVTQLAYVGGTSRSAVAHGAVHVPDAVGGRVAVGPERSALLGVLSALMHAESAGCDGAVIIACDVPLLTPATISSLCDALDSAEIAVASAERSHWTIIAARTSTRPLLEHQYETGVRALHEALAHCKVQLVPVAEHELVNANDQKTLQAIADSPSAHG